MRKALLCAGILCLGLALVIAAEKESTAPAHKPPAKSHPGFERLKALAGEWDGKTSGGGAVHVTYRIASSGTALMETLDTPDGANMITMYHPDGNRLMVTHYCSSNNQPRMATRPGDSASGPIVFDYVDVTNLEASTEGVMTGLTLTLEDADHISQTWTFRDKPGGSPQSDTFRYVRKK